MTVTSVRQLTDTGGDDNEGGVTAVRTYRVTTNNVSDTWETIRSASGIPSNGDSYASGSSMIVVNRSAKRVTERKDKWHVTVNYDIPRNSDGSPAGGSGGVENEIPEYSRTTETEWEYRDVDLDNLPIANSAKEPFTPPLEFPQTIAVYTIARNRLTFDDAGSLPYINAVNSAAFNVTAPNLNWGFPAETALMTRYDSVRRFRADIGYYYRVTWEIKYREDGWRKFLLDQGFMMLDADEVPLSYAPAKTIKGSDGLPISSPRLLDGAGGLLADGAAPVFVPAGNGFRRFNLVDFSSLPLSVT
jgi:hypothetical protein